MGPCHCLSFMFKELKSRNVEIVAMFLLSTKKEERFFIMIG